MADHIREFISKTGTYFMSLSADGSSLLDTEDKEFQGLMRLSVKDRASALKEEVVLSTFDSCPQSDSMMWAPYIVRFSGQKLSALLQSLPDADQIDLLTMSVREKTKICGIKSTVYRKRRNYLQELVLKLPEEEQEKILRRTQKKQSFWARVTAKFLGRERME